MIYFINPPDNILEKKGDRPPLGLMYLSSYIKQFGATTKIYDLNHDYETDVEREIISNSPDFLCFGVAITSYRRVINYIRSLREKGYSGKIIGGGNHITNIAYDSEPQKFFDFLVIGDGENALKEILENTSSNKVIKSKDIDDLDSLPFPDYDCVNMRNYSMTVEGKKGALMVASRGCIYSCIYCGSAKIKKVRQRTPENIIAEMQLLYEKYNIRGFYFGDDIFTFDEKRTLEICDLIKENFRDIVFRITTRANLLTPQICKSLKESGCSIVCLGLESGNNEILKLIKKGETTEIQRKGVEMCHDAGLKVKGFFIIGLPGETRKTALQTIEFAKSLNLEYVDCYPITPYPGTPLWDDPEKYGLEIIKPLDCNWDEYYQVGIKGAEHEIKLKHNNLSQKEIIEFVELFNKEVCKSGLTY